MDGDVRRWRVCIASVAMSTCMGIYEMMATRAESPHRSGFFHSCSSQAFTATIIIHLGPALATDRPNRHAAPRSRDAPPLQLGRIATTQGSHRQSW